MPMKKHITLILVLMVMCVAGIIGLQLFWNYQNYKTTVKNFDHDVNEALNKAVDREMDQRQQLIINRFKTWLADTSFITITVDHNNRDSNTVFHTTETHPKFKGEKGITFGFEDIPEKLNTLTPRAKSIFIDHFSDRILRNDLKNGFLYNYTPLLGDSLTKIYEASKANTLNIGKLFKEELSARDIHISFTFNPAKSSKPYLTRVVNAHFRRPYKQDLVYASLENPNTYFLKEMKWVLIGSLLLIAITICCFGYTVKTLLSQHQLAILKDEFINNMTHELNTPISSIKITAEALKSFKQTPETETEYLDIISYQAEKLTGLTTQILNTGRLINIDKNQTVININELLQKAINDLKPQFDKSQAKVNYHTLQPALYVNGEATGLLAVFTNIIDNALKYNTNIPKIAITLSNQNAYAEVEFADNGIGIPVEYQEKIFEKFFRVPQGNLHNVKGYGLGLSYVSQIIIQHKGLVSASSNHPIGSIITIKIPLANG